MQTLTETNDIGVTRGDSGLGFNTKATFFKKGIRHNRIFKGWLNWEQVETRLIMGFKVNRSDIASVEHVAA